MEQRALHALAQGGVILVEKDPQNKIITANCVNREGWYLSGFNISIFKKLKRRKFIRSCGGRPYQITMHGLKSVRSQLDNR